MQLEEAFWLASPVRPGESAEFLTRWRITNPEKIGKPHPPAFQPDTIFFTHLLDDEGQIVSQRDALDAPSWNWQVGDTLLQIHRLDLPQDMSAGPYRPFVGIYDRQTGERLPLSDDSGTGGGTLFEGPALEVAQS